MNRALASPSEMDALTVVIRAAGERTAAACRQLLQPEVAAGNVVTVSNAPFSATLADSYRAGIERGLPWTLCIDADVLVLPGGVSRLLAFAHTLGNDVCEVQGVVLDKFFGVQRPAGNHLYRTEWLPKALEFIPPEGRDMRPEFYTLNRMSASGHPWVETPVLIGLHDFEQSYADIFRKCCVHARKHGPHLHLLADFWRRRAPADRDFQVALWGLAAGLIETDEVRVDVRKQYGLDRWTRGREWKDKEPLAGDELTPDRVAALLAAWESPGEVLERLGMNSALEIVHDGRASEAQRKKTWREKGWLGLVPWLMGRALGKAGRRLERLAS